MKPVLQALVLAERVWTDESGSKIIAGTLNHLLICPRKTKSLGHTDGSQQQIVQGGELGCLWVYISLTDVVDGTQLSLRMVDMVKNEAIFRQTITVAPGDRLATVEVVAPLPGLRLFVKKPGVFSFDVVWSGELLGSHRLTVEAMPSSDEPGTPTEET